MNLKRDIHCIRDYSVNIIRSSYANAGYYSEGKKYDEYADYYEYYLVYPGNTVYRKLTMKEKVVRRALKDEAI